MTLTTRFTLLLVLGLLAQAGRSQNIGDRCVPGAVGRPGLTCQATGEWEWDGPCILNAQTGDVITDVGDGLIGQLLAQMNPPQYSDHCGIIANDVPMKVCNATCSQDWLTDQKYWDTYSILGNDVPYGISPDDLQHGWPGTITLLLQEAFEGPNLINPSRNKMYHLNLFGTDPLKQSKSPTPVAFPDVVKPFWRLEFDTASVRPNLHQIAGAAQALSGHYRWYAYSQGAIWNDPTYASCPSSWCAGNHNIPVCCSSLIWAAAQSAGIRVERDQADPYDPRDHHDRPHIPGRPGLYAYGEAERKAAGSALFAGVWNLGKDKISWWNAPLSEPAVSRVANQVCNALAYDDCSHPWDWSDPGTDRWSSPGTGAAVSPDDLKNWDEPPGGVYGHNEPLAYVGTSYQRINRWAASPGTGTIVVQPYLDPTVPLTGGAATVDLGWAGLSAKTGADGTAVFEGLPAGNYDPVVTAVFSDGKYTADQLVTLPPDGFIGVGLQLKPPRPPAPPPNFFRQVIVSGTMSIQDADCFGDENNSFTFTLDPILLDPIHNKQHFDYGNRVDEVIGGVYGDLELILVNGQPIVTCNGHVRLCEGDCSGDNVKADWPYNFDDLGVQISFWADCKYSWTCGDDDVYVTVTITNDQDPNPHWP